VTGGAAAFDFFALEAGDYLTHIERWASADEASPAPGAGAGAAPGAGAGGLAEATRAARALRGAATVARQPDVAALAAAVERALDGGGPGAADAVLGAVDAVRAALRAPRPLPPETAERLRAAAAAVDAQAGPRPDRPPAGGERIVPIRALAADGDADYVVHRAPAPAATADGRFRAASLPLARGLRHLVADARAAIAEAPGSDADLARTLGADLRAALADLRELAESYDVRPAATFFAGREAGAAALDPRALAAVDAAAAGLIDGRPAGEAPTAGGAAEPADAPARAPDSADATAPAPASPPADAPAAARPAATAGVAAAPGAAAPSTRDTGPRPAPDAPAADALAPGAGAKTRRERPPTGDALVALLETGITRIGQLEPFDEVEAPPPAAPAATGGVVPVEQLLYAGRAALERAREVRDQLRARQGPPDPELLAELYDLLDLAAS
jgi:hypothetical protein